MENTYKAANLIKDVDVKGRTVVAYASVFGNIDSDDDIIQQGSYQKTIQENGPAGKNRVWHLFNHWLDHPIGKPYDLKEDNTGLLFASKLPDTTKANDLLKLYESGFLTEHSVVSIPEMVRLIVLEDKNNHTIDAIGYMLTPLIKQPVKNFVI